MVNDVRGFNWCFTETEPTFNRQGDVNWPFWDVKKKLAFSQKIDEK